METRETLAEILIAEMRIPVPPAPSILRIPHPSKGKRRRAYGAGPKPDCSACGKPLEAHRLGTHRYCLSCHAATMRRRRALRKAR